MSIPFFLHGMSDWSVVWWLVFLLPSLFLPMRGLVWYHERAHGLSWAQRSETCSECPPSNSQLNIVQGCHVPRPSLDLLSKCLLAQFSSNPEKLFPQRCEKHPSTVPFYSADLFWPLRRLETLWSRIGWNGRKMNEWMWMLTWTDWDLMTSVTVVKDSPRKYWGKS